MNTIAVKKLTLLEACRGLMGKTKPEAILFKTRFGIHTFFMRFPIDVIILNKDYTVVKIKQNLQPNTIFIWNPKYTIVLELPQGTIEKEKIKIGEKLKIYR